MRECTLHINLLDYWHCGSGRGAGSHTDAVIDRDDAGLPYVPGRMLKGLLRDAFESLHHFTVGDSTDIERLFGPRLGDERTRHQFGQGLLAISNGSLDPQTTRWLASRDAGQAREQLTRTIYATAMDNGVARAQSLRSIEVAVPMRLQASVSGPDEATWIADLTRAAGLVRALGAHRSRGLGRCHLTVEERDHA